MHKNLVVRRSLAVILIVLSVLSVVSAVLLYKVFIAALVLAYFCVLFSIVAHTLWQEDPRLTGLKRDVFWAVAAAAVIIVLAASQSAIMQERDIPQKCVVEGDAVNCTALEYLNTKTPDLTFYLTPNTDVSIEGVQLYHHDQLFDVATWCVRTGFEWRCGIPDGEQQLSLDGVVIVTHTDTGLVTEYPLVIRAHAR